MRGGSFVEIDVWVQFSSTIDYVSLFSLVVERRRMRLE